MNIIITGATAGFGEAMVRSFVKNGDHVIATGRRVDRLQKLAKELGSQVQPIELDVRNAEQVKKTFSELPPIDVLINNAGLAMGMEPAQKSQLEDWDVMVDTNIKGVLHCTHAVLPGMVARNTGHIINLGSVAGEFPYPSGNVYGASKAFLHQFSLNLRADLLGTAVRVTCIEPGMCGGTEFSEVRFKGDKERAANWYKGVEYLTSEDIAETVLWVASRPAHVNINVISMMPVQQSRHFG